MGTVIDEKRQEVSDFLDRVAQLSAEDKNIKILLRKSIGLKYDEINSYIRMAFLKTDPPQRMNYDKALLCAGLQCLWSNNDLVHAVEMPNIKHRLDKFSAATLEKRILKALDIPWDNDGFLLNKIVRLVVMCKQKGYVVDCKHLLYSLSFWDSPSRFIQQDWCEALCNKKKVVKPKKEEKKSA